MPQKEILLTAEGRQKLIDELEYLEGDKRAEVGERIRVAREFGDISENSEYDDAKNEQAWVEGRIAEISQILANAVVPDKPKRATRVTIGNTVTLEDQDGKGMVVTLVGSAEADPRSGRVSNESPIGSALMGRKKGEEFEFTTPSGKTQTYTVIKISNK